MARISREAQSRAAGSDSDKQFELAIDRITGLGLDNKSCVANEKLCEKSKVVNEKRVLIKRKFVLIIKTLVIEFDPEIKAFGKTTTRLILPTLFSVF